MKQLKTEMRYSQVFKLNMITPCTKVRIQAVTTFCMQTTKKVYGNVCQHIGLQHTHTDTDTDKDGKKLLCLNLSLFYLVMSIIIIILITMLSLLCYTIAGRPSALSKIEDRYHMYTYLIKHVKTDYNTEDVENHDEGFELEGLTVLHPFRAKPYKTKVKCDGDEGRDGGRHQKPILNTLVWWNIIYI